MISDRRNQAGLIPTKVKRQNCKMQTQYARDSRTCDFIIYPEKCLEH